MTTPPPWHGVHRYCTDDCDPVTPHDTYVSRDPRAHYRTRIARQVALSYGSR